MSDKAETEVKKKSSLTGWFWAGLALIILIFVIWGMVAGSSKRTAETPGTLSPAEQLDEQIELAKKQKQLREITGQQAVAPAYSPSSAHSAPEAAAPEMSGAVRVSMGGDRIRQFTLSTTSWSPVCWVSGPWIDLDRTPIDKPIIVWFKAEGSPWQQVTLQPYEKFSGKARTPVEAFAFRGGVDGQTITVKVSERPIGQ